MNYVRSYTTIITATPAAASFATPYSSGDVIGGANTLTNAVHKTPGTGIIQSIVVLDKANQKSALDILFFDTTPANSFGADNAAYALNDADLGYCLGRYSVAAADYVSSSTNSAEATIRSVGLPIKAATGARDIYMVVVSRGTPTYGSATDLIVRVGILQD